MKKKRLFLLIGMLLVLALCGCLVACSGGSSTEEEPDDPVTPSGRTLSPQQSLDKVYNGLLAGGSSIENATTYGVDTTFTVYTRPASGVGFGMLNYTLTYKANYNENYADSRIYIRAFDNNAHKDRFVVYFDGSDLYFRSVDEAYVISRFSTTMMFNVFFETCRELDMTMHFFSNDLGSIFNRNSTANLGLIVNGNNTKYRYAGANKEVVEYAGLELTILNESVNNAMENYFRGVGDKFDLISQKYLGFSVNRLAETRLNTIIADLIQTRLTNNVATETVWEIGGRLQDTSYYKIQADVGYNDGTGALVDKDAFVKSTYTEASLGQNRLLGSILIPAFSDVEYDAEIITDIHTNDNLANEISVRILDAVGTDFFSAYYRTGKAYVNVSGIDEWLDGAIDIDALNLPKVYFPDIDVSKLINAAYNNVVKSMLRAVQKGVDGTAIDRETYETVMENFGNDGVSYVYYIFTEEWYHKISGDEEPIMDKVARALGVEKAQLESYLGSDFFLDAEAELGYDLESGVVTFILREAGEDLFILHAERDAYRGVTFPADVYEGTPTYARLKLPDVITMDFSAEFAVRNGKTSTELSYVLGTLIGDPSGINSKNILRSTEVLLAEGSVSEIFYVNADGETVSDNVVDLSLYIRKNNSTERVPVVNVRTNPNDRTELLVSYYVAMGVDLSAEDNKSGLFYRLKKQVVSDSFDELLGEDNLFSETNVVTILDKILTTKGISQVSKIGGWFEFSLVVSERQDPVKELLGVADTTATVKARIKFIGPDNEIDLSGFVVPTITPLENIVIGTVYDASSAWKDRVEVIINGTLFHCQPNYFEESVTVVTGKTVYHPTAKLFGKEIGYEVVVTDEVGTYRISRLYDPIIILDPTQTSVLPDKVEVVYDNGVRGYLTCKIEGFEESNITLAGYNLSGFANVFDDSMKSTVVIGVDSIMNVSFDVYILVHNRKIIPATEGGRTLTDGNGVPVVATVLVDPYTYAMRLRDDPSYDPVKDGLRRTQAELLFENVYGQEEVPVDDSIVVRDLTYDVLGYNRFVLSDLDVAWDYDPERISWQGSSGYAYARFGSDQGEALDIAVRMIVAAQTVDHISIDDEDNDVYTIDFLQRATYNIPTQTNALHTVRIFFKGQDSVYMKYRYVSLSRPDGLTDDEYHDNYLAVTLNWDGIAREVAENPYVITASRNDQQSVSATFGSALKVGTQTVRLTVEIPERTQDNSAAEAHYVATSCVENEYGDYEFVKNNVSPSKAYFPKTDGIEYGFYEYLRINPYDSAFRIPNSVYLEVPKVSGYKAATVVKKYDVRWVTTDPNGNELNLIEEKVGGGFGLKHPVTDEMDLVVYGMIGDRGNEPNNNRNLGYVWVVMIIRNEKSQLQSIRYSGLEEGEDTIFGIDPYEDYFLPYSFVAVLESGRTIERYGVEWEVRVGEEGSYAWYPATYTPGSGAPEQYYKDGKFVFDRKGGYTAIRYVIEGDSESIRQTLSLNVEVLKRTLASDRVDIYAVEGDQPKQGYAGIDVYEEGSQKIYDRFVEIRDGDDVAGVTFVETGSYGVYVPKYLSVDWTRALPVDGDYSHSLDYLMVLLTSADAVQELLQVSIDGSMTLTGTIYTGTINEQTLSVKFSFEDRKIADILLTRMAYAQEKDAVRIGTITPETVALDPYADDEERSANRRVSLLSLGDPHVLNIRLDKPFALTAPDAQDQERYASPSAYFDYILGLVQISFTGSAAEKIVTPTLSYPKDKDAFDAEVLSPASTYGTFNFTIEKLSAGSAIDRITVNVYVLKDERLGDSDSITPELYDETGKQLYSESKPYYLPEYINVEYKNSGVVRYDGPAWKAEGVGMEELFGGEYTPIIEAKLLNVIRSFADSDKQANLYNFAYDLPCVDATYRITVYVPKKDVKKTNYRAVGETSLYDIKDGVLTIDNPYLYYDPDVEYVDGKKYGFDVSKVPSTIVPNVDGFDFWATEVTSYDVAWQFIEGVFTSDLFATGTADNLLLAKAILPAYYDYNNGEYVAQNQEINLYLKVNALSFDGISADRVNVVEQEGTGVRNVIEIDPYNDINGYAGRFNMPVNGLTVRFGAESYVFNDVMFYLRSKTGSEYPTRIMTVEYNERGHLFDRADYPDLREDGVLEFNMYLPGFGLSYDEEGEAVRDDAKALRIYLNVLSKVIDTAFVPNVVYDSLGIARRTTYVDETGAEKDVAETKYLPALYYIDPYNAATFALPTEMRVLFVGYDVTEDITISGWQIRDEETGVWSDFGTDATSDFYARTATGDSSVRYGYYNPGAYGYQGKVYDNIRGYISMGRSISNEITKQFFAVTIIVLNRSLKATYTTSYRYEDPFGGLLSYIGGETNEDMFVSYEKYYEEYFVEKGLDEEYKYSAFGTPVVPSINWAVYNEESVIEPLGGFDKEIGGNVYFGATHRDNSYVGIKAAQDERFEQLARALTFDAYFTEGGYPLAYYSANTTNNLNALSAALKNDVIYRTYELLIEKLASSDEETEKQYGNYLTNGLVNEIVAEHNYSRESQMTRIVVTMYNLLKEEYEAQSSERSAIYKLWQEVYEEFVTAGSATDPNLSEYQRLKAHYYALANDDSAPTFTEQEKISTNAPLRAAIDSRLRWYEKATIYDEVYDHATAAERAVMDRILLVAADTDSVFEGVPLVTIYRAVALDMYLQSSIASLGSVGEGTVARVTAPAITLGDVYDLTARDEHGEYPILTEFLFNLFSEEPYLTEVGVSFVANYANVYAKYIEEGIRLAVEQYRARPEAKQYSLTEYVKERVRQYVNDIVPLVDDPDKTGGEQKPLIDFTYETYGDNVNRYPDYWRALYAYHEQESQTYLAGYERYTTYQERWEMAIRAHVLRDEQYIVDEMEEIYARALANDEIPGGDPKYQTAWEGYVKLTHDYYLVEMDPPLERAIMEANAAVADNVFAFGNWLAPLTSAGGGNYGTYSTIFSRMYGDLLVEAYDVLYASLAFDTSLQARLNAEYLANSMDKGVTMHSVMSNNTLDSTIVSRANYIFLWKLGSADAWDVLYENAESVGYSRVALDYMIEVASTEKGYLRETNYNVGTGSGAAFSEDEFASYGKTVLLERIISATTNVDNKAKITAWRDAAVNPAKSAAFESFHHVILDEDHRDTDAETLYAIRDVQGNVYTNAFRYFVAGREALGDSLNASIDDLREEYYDRVVFDSSSLAVERLLSDSLFAYKQYLTQTAEQTADYKARAIAYYEEKYATHHEKAVIEVEKVKHSTDAETYDALLARADVTDALKNGLRNGYATVVLNETFDRIKVDIEEEIRGKIENNEESSDATFTNISDKNVTTFINVSASDYTLDNAQPGMIREVSIYDYVRTVFTQKTESYNTFVADKRTAARDDATAVAYESLYGSDQALFDEVLDRYYVALAADPVTAGDSIKNYLAFNAIIDLLAQEELAHYNDAVAEVTALAVASELYDDLGRFDKIHALAEAEALLDAYRAVADGFVGEERDVLNRVVSLDALFTDKTTAQALLAVAEQYELLLDREVAEEVKPLVERFLSGIKTVSDAFLSNTSTAFDAALSVAIAASYDERIKESGGTVNEKASATNGAVAIAVVLYETESASEKIARDYLSNDNLSGDFSVTGDEYRHAYVEGLKKVLSDNKYLSATAYVEKTEEGYEDSIVADVDGKEKIYATVIAKLLLTGDGPTVRKTFAEEVRAYESAVEDSLTTIAQGKLYADLGAYRMLTGDGTELFEQFKTVYNGLTAGDKSAIDRCFDSDLFTTTYASADAAYAAFLDAYDGLLQSGGTGSQEQTNRVLNLFESAAAAYRSTVSDTAVATAITDGVVTSVSDAYRLADSYDARGVVVRGMIGVAKVLAHTVTMRSGIPSSYFTTDNLAGDYTVTGASYNASYVSNLIGAIRSFGYTSAVTVSNGYLDGYKEGIYSDEESLVVLNTYVRNKLLQTYSASMTEKFMTQFGAGRTDLMTLLNEGYAMIDTDAFVTAKTSSIEARLNEYRQKAEGSRTDAAYESVFSAMQSDEDAVVKPFRTDVYATVDDYALGSDFYASRVGKYGIVIDAIGLTQSSDNYYNNAKLHILNGYKMDDFDLVRDGWRIRFASVTPTDVDFYGGAYIMTDSDGNYVLKDAEDAAGFANTLVIDPLAPILPDKVQAYGKYNLPEGGVRLYDLGTPAVEYGDLFYENVYDGQEQNDTDYVINLIDSRGRRYPVTVAVTYLDASVERISVTDSKNYGGSEDEYNTGYYTLYDEETGINRILIDPINEDIIDVENKKYVLPTEILVTYANLTNEDGSKKQAALNNVTWDDSAVKYSLTGQTDVQIRPLGYTVRMDGVEYTVRFDYSGTGSIAVSANGTAVVMRNAPGYEVFNIVLSVTDRTVTRLSVRGEERETTTFGTYDEEGAYIDVSADVHTLNPFDITYPDKLVLDFNGGDQKDYAITDWALEYGATGSFKMADIIQNNALDYHAVAQFSYLGYTIRVRYVVEDIHIEGIEQDASGERIYIDGGTIYLVAGGGSAGDQLAKNYPYLYYNFGTGARADFRKVALSFADMWLNDVSTESPGTYESVLGVLGWDKVAYPSLGLTNNITFRVEVINPLMVALLDDEYNRYVRMDYTSVPYDNNFQRANYSEEPAGTIPDAIVSLTDSGRTEFVLDKDATSYDILGKKATFRCLFDLNGSNFRVAADENGNRTKAFFVTMPLDAYLHTAVTDAVFDPTPVKDGYGEDVWTWAGNEDGDAILWKLGKELRSSDLPRLTYVYEGDVYEIKPLWDLTGLNVNRATEDGYTIYAFYYDRNGAWRELPLTVYIDKVDITEKILAAVGGNMALEYSYDAHYYRLPLDLNADVMTVLREDGSYMALDGSAVDIRYKLSSAPERDYSRTNYPIDVGEYTIKVNVFDYNAMLVDEMLFRLTITPIRIPIAAIEFENRLNNVVQYTYDGTAKPLTVESGLPYVTADNWFSSQEEKNRLVEVQRQANPGISTVTAKSYAYLELFGRVPGGAKSRLTEVSMQIRQETGLLGEELNATVFDSLTPDFTYVEVAVKVSYTQGNKEIGSIPTDVGSYTALFSLDSVQNRGNYELGYGDQTTIAVALNIEKPNIEYSYVSTDLVYSGRMQNPLINGLHDEEGNLPAGVRVHYTYKRNVSGEDVYLEDGVINVGSYLCEAQIDGGNNYHNATLNTTTVNVLPKTLYVRLKDAGSDYLDEVADLHSYLEFVGLVGGEDASVFGYPDVITDVRDYFTIGNGYEYELDGFKIDINHATPYTYEVSEKEIDGVTYKRLALRPIPEPGSLYGYVNGDGSYSYASLISRFDNYEVYVQKTGRYIISVSGGTGLSIRRAGAEDRTGLIDIVATVVSGERTEIYLPYDYVGDAVDTTYGALRVTGTAIVTLYRYTDDSKSSAECLGSVRSVGGQKVKVYEVSSDAEFASAVSGARDGARVEVYLKSNFDAEGKPIEKDYGNVEMNVAGSVSIYGCYDKDKNLVTWLNGITVSDGALDLHIVGFRTAAGGDICVDIGPGADNVRISDGCRFYSYHEEEQDGETATISDKNTVGVRTDANYTGTLTISGCVYSGFRRAVEHVGGNLRIEDTDFSDNYIGLSVESVSGDVNVLSDRFSGNEVGIVIRYGKFSQGSVDQSAITIGYNIRFNTLVRNRFGIVVDDSIADLTELTEDSLVGGNNTDSGAYVFDDTNVVKVATSTQWAATQQGA